MGRTHLCCYSGAVSESYMWGPEVPSLLRQGLGMWTEIEETIITCNLDLV